MPRRSLPWGECWRCFAADERGNIALLFAFFISIGTAVSALAVDEGALYLQRREAQSATDLASIAAASDPADGFARARTALSEAGLIASGETDSELKSGTGRQTLIVDAGSYSADPSLAVSARFVAGATSVNAVKVHFETRGELYFAQSWAAAPTIGVSATASTTPEVRFSVGSTLAALSGGIPNAILNALLGANVTLSAVSYNGLLNTKVSVFGFLDALAQELNISAGSYSDVLAASADQGQIASAIATTLTGADATAAQTLAQALGHNGTLQIGKLLDLGSAAQLAIGTGKLSGYDANVSALEMLTATGALSDGTHQVSLNLTANVPGLTSLTMSLAVGEPQQFASWFALGPSGTIVRTAQIRLRFVATLAGGSGLGGGVVRVPIYLAVAYAEAGAQSATCPIGGAPTGSAVIATQPGIASLTLGDVADPGFGDFTTTPTISPATLINLLLLKVTASGQAAMGQLNPTSLSFSPTDIENGTIKEATTTDFTSSLTASLLSSLTLNVSVLGLGLPSISGIKALVSQLVTPLGPVLDTTIATTLDALGLKLGIADVQVYGVTCSRAVLVG
jgi:uncharacterized membrane protein